MSIKIKIACFLAATALIATTAVGLAAPAAADEICNVDNLCTEYSAQTPLGPVDITVSPTNVVTVHLTPSDPQTRVHGRPTAYPPGPPVPLGIVRTSVTTLAGIVNIDTILHPPGPISPSLAVISLFHPPSPIRVTTTGTTVVFTPVR